MFPSLAWEEGARAAQATLINLPEVGASILNNQASSSRCSFSMMVKWANDGTLQAYDGKMLVNDGEMSIWSYTQFTIIDWHFTIINEYFTIISLKCTIIHSFDHHWEATPTV